MRAPFPLPLESTPPPLPRRRTKIRMDVVAQMWNVVAYGEEKGHQQVKRPLRMCLVLETNFTLCNNTDTGPCSGAWALDQLQVSVKVYQDIVVAASTINNTTTSTRSRPTGLATQYTYVADVNGTWATFAGARSPQGCVIQPCDGHGIVVGLFTGSLGRSWLPPAHPALPVCKTSKACYDQRGTRANILLPKKDQNPNLPNVESALKRHLKSPDLTVASFSAIYYYNGQVVWTNFPTGNTGDVIISSTPCCLGPRPLQAANTTTNTATTQRKKKKTPAPNTSQTRHRDRPSVAPPK